MRVHGSPSFGTNSCGVGCDTRSWAGTKYLIIFPSQEMFCCWFGSSWCWNFARKLNFSIISRILCCKGLYLPPSKSLNTLSMSSFCKTPVSSSTCHNSRSTGSFQLEKWKRTYLANQIIWKSSFFASETNNLRCWRSCNENKTDRLLDTMLMVGWEFLQTQGHTIPSSLCLPK